MNGKELAKQTLDQIPQTNSNAKRIVGLMKEGGRIIGYRIVRSSGDAKVDQSVLAAAKRAGYVAGLSADFLKRYAEITIEMNPKRQ